MHVVRSNNDRHEIDALLRTVCSTEKRRKRMLHILRSTWKKVGQTVILVVCVPLPTWVYLFFRPTRNHVSIWHDVGVVTITACLVAYQSVALVFSLYIWDEIWKKSRLLRGPVR